MSDPTQGAPQPIEQAPGALNPFPQETQEQVQGAALNGSWNPWEGPAKPGFWSGAGFSEDNPLGPLESFALKPLGQATAAGELLLAGAAHRVNAFAVQHLGNEPGIGPFLKNQEQRSAALEQDATQRVNALTPDPQTTGTAVQTIGALVSGGYRAAVGTMLGGPIGGAALLGSTQGAMRYKELREQGVAPGTAAESAGITGVTAGAGALIPGGFGAGAFAKIATGAAANVGLGVASRYADHQVLEDAGYHAMADQERVWDGVGMVTDALLGGAFSGLAHLHAAAEAGRSKDGTPSALDAAGARDAALTANLAMRDRAASPGAPVDPAAAAAHQQALKTALTQLLSNEPVDIADLPERDAAFVPRPAPETGDLHALFTNALQEAGVLEEQRNVEALERSLSGRLAGEEPEPGNVQTPAPEQPPSPEDVMPFMEPAGGEAESVTSEAGASAPAYTVHEEPLTDEQLRQFQGLRSQVPTEEELAGARGREPGEPGPQNAGQPRARSGEPLRVYRGADRELAPADFEPGALGRSSGHPSSGLGVFFSLSREEAARYGEVAEHHLDIRNPKVTRAEDLPGFDSAEEAHAYREKLRAQGYDGIVIDGSHLGGPVNYVAFEPHQAIPARAAIDPLADPAIQALQERPDLTIAGEEGQPVQAAEALNQASQAVTDAERDAPKGLTAAVNCFLRGGM